MTCRSTLQTPLGTRQLPPALFAHPSALRGLLGTFSSLCTRCLLKHEGSKGRMRRLGAGGSINSPKSKQYVDLFKIRCSRAQLTLGTWVREPRATRVLQASGQLGPGHAPSRQPLRILEVGAISEGVCSSCCRAGGGRQQ